MRSRLPDRGTERIEVESSPAQGPMEVGVAVDCLADQVVDVSVFNSNERAMERDFTLKLSAYRPMDAKTI